MHLQELFQTNRKFWGLSLFQAENLFFLNNVFRMHFVKNVILLFGIYAKIPAFLIPTLNKFKEKKFSSVYIRLLVSVPVYKYKFSFLKKTAAKFEKHI
jgi:hypothetical protein